MNKVHDLKVYSIYFEDLFNGTKTFELRLNDRDYSVGDLLFLREWDKIENCYTGRYLIYEINYMLSNVNGLDKDYVLLGIFPY